MSGIVPMFGRSADPEARCHSSTYAPLGARSIITDPSSFHFRGPGSKAETGWMAMSSGPRVCHSAVADGCLRHFFRFDQCASGAPVLASHADGSTMSTGMRTSTIADSNWSHSTIESVSLLPSSFTIDARRQVPSSRSGNTFSHSGEAYRVDQSSWPGRQRPFFTSPRRRSTSTRRRAGCLGSAW